MPSPSRDKLLLGLGVAAASAGGLALSSLLLWNRFKSISAAFTDLSREVSILRAEVNELKSKGDKPAVRTRPQYEGKNQKTFSSMSSGDEPYLSAQEEFQDNFAEVGDKLYERVDALLRDPQIEHRQRAYQLMKWHRARNQHNCDFLWRLARATYLYAQLYAHVDNEKRKELCFEAKNYAYEAEAVEADNADVQKWCALTVGTLTDFLPMGDKIKNGHVFKKHIDAALAQKPEDSTLHHLKGRWCFAVASLSWVERKADEYSTEDWAENFLFMAKTLAVLGDSDESRNCLKRACASHVTTPDDAAARDEAKLMLKDV